SGGRQRGVAPAPAPVGEPDVLLRDEPLSNLDAKLRARVRAELKEIQQSLGKTTILVTHDQEEALSISDRIAVMEAGRIRQTGTPLEVYAHPADAFVADFIGIANFVPATVRAAGPNGVVLDSPLGLLATTKVGGLSAGQAVTVVLRPTALRLCATPQHGRVQASLRSSSFLGELRRFHLQLGQLSLVVDQLPEEAGETPDEPWLAFNPAV